MKRKNPYNNNLPSLKKKKLVDVSHSPEEKNIEDNLNIFFAQFENKLQSLKNAGKIQLYCVDFDQTLIKGHVYTYLKDNYRPYIKGFGVIVDKEPPIGQTICKDYNPNLFRESLHNYYSDSSTGFSDAPFFCKLFKIIIDKGHNVAITSFNDYPDAIDIALEDMGLSKGYTHIKVVCGVPEDISSKMEHIKPAMNLYNVHSYTNVTLIDDSLGNIYTARKEGVGGILFKNKSSSPITELITDLNPYIFTPEDEFKEMILQNENNENLDNNNSIAIKDTPPNDEVYGAGESVIIPSDL